MATPVNFEGRRIILPGVYSVVKSGIRNPPISLSYGNVLIVDTGSGTGYGGGSGINGELADGADAIYPVDNIDDFRILTKGGYWYTLGRPLFEPQPQPGISGVSMVNYVRAATTVGANMVFAPTGQADATPLGTPQTVTATIKCRDEGTIGNGLLVSSELSKGYAYILKAGVRDTSKFILEFYRGTFTGLADDGFPYGDVSEADSIPLTVVTSREVSDWSDFINWAENDSTFQEYFSLTTSGDTSDGVVIGAHDLTQLATYQLATGGTETFGAADLTAALEAAATLRYSFILSDKYGDDAQDTVNDSLLNHVLSPDTSFEKMIFIGGGVDDTKFTQANGSIPAAEHFNSDRVVVVHGGVKVDSSITPTRSRNWDALYSAALVLGRIAGLEPQTPGTFKTLPIRGLLHELINQEKEVGLQAGVLLLHLDTQLLTPSYTILQAVNTIQNNINQINEDGTTREVSIRRIAAQLNLELIINASRDLFGNEEGTNLNKLTDQTVIDWTAGQLQFRTATTTDDNLIIEFRNISVTTQQDAKFVTYEFKPNSPINKFFLTGFMVE